jgi:hypothetical protein
MYLSCAGIVEVWSKLTGTASQISSQPTPCALRAPTVISVRIKAIRTKIAVIAKSKVTAGFHTRSPITHGWLLNRV